MKKITTLRSIINTPQTEFIHMRQLDLNFGGRPSAFLDLPETQNFIDHLVKNKTVNSIAELRRYGAGGEVYFSPILALKYLAHLDKSIEAEIYLMAYHSKLV